MVPPPAQGEVLGTDSSRAEWPWQGEEDLLHLSSFPGTHGGIHCHIWSSESLSTQPSLRALGYPLMALHGVLPGNAHGRQPAPCGPAAVTYLLTLLPAWLRRPERPLGKRSKARFLRAKGFEHNPQKLGWSARLGEGKLIW